MRIDELRSTLQDHADLSYDEGLSSRADAVRGRVRAVRRRRAGVVAACAVGAVVAVPAINALDVDVPEPAGRDLAGRTAPESFVANGFTYEFDDGVEGAADEPLDLRLPRSDEPRLVSWTVNDAEADGRLVDRTWAGDYDDDWVAGGTGFETYDYVPAGSPASYRLTSTEGGADGEMAMAVYTLGEALPGSFSAEGLTFRQQVDGAELLGAAVGRGEEAEVSTEITVPEGDVRFAGTCSGAGSDYMVHVGVQGQRGYTATTCGGEVERDAGAGSWTQYQLVGTKRKDGSRFRAGETVTVTASLHPKERGRTEPVSVPGAVFGFGAYDEDPGEPVGATEDTVDRMVERDGHTWALTDLDVSEPEASNHVVRLGPVAEETYVDLGAANDPPGRGDGADLRWRTSIDGENVGRSYRGRNGSSGPGLEIRLTKGDSMTIDQSAISGVDEYLSFYVATYTLAD